MSKEFKVFKLGEVTEIIAGGDKPKIFSLEKSDINSIPVFANAEKANGLQGYTDSPRIMDRSVTVAARGSNVGFVAVRKEPFFPIVRLLTLIPNTSRLNADYLFYNLKLNRLNGTGSGQPQITTPDISNRTISLPSLPTQQKIAAVLSALDDKIELNSRLNAELEQMAKTLFDYWFVQFDFPNEEGKPYKTSGGKMGYNEELKRVIPKGWEVKDLGDLCYKIGDGIHGTPKYVENSTYAFINGNNLKSGFIQIDSDTKRVIFEEYQKYLIKLNADTILLSINGTLGNLALYNGEKVMLGKSAAYINCKENNLLYCYQYLSQNEIQKSFWNIATGSTIKNLSLDSIKKLKILFPSEQLVKNFNNITNPFHCKRINIFHQNQELAALRDWLLPMLMNGQVSVRKAHSGTEVELPKFEMVAEPVAEYGRS